MVYGDFQRRVANHKVSTDDLSLDTRHQNDPDRISHDRVVLDHVTRVCRIHGANTEVTPLGYITISNQPVPTDPVAASAARESYTSTGGTEVSIPY